MARLRGFCFAVLVLAIIAFGDACSNSSPGISIGLSPSSSQAIDQSQTITIKANVINDKSGKGVTWTFTGPGSLSNSTASTVTYNTSTNAITTPQQVTLTATSIADSTKSASVQITVNPFPQIPVQQLQSGSVGAAYSQTLTFTGGTPPFQWGIYNGPIITGNFVGGSVPDGLTLNTSTGTISGTPTGGGTWYFEATVTDAAGAAVANPFLSIQVNSGAAPGNPVPFLNEPLSPAATTPGSSAFVLNVTGTGFVSGASVNFNNTPLTTTFVNSAHLTAVVPAANVANAGTASVSVLNPAPGGGRSNMVYLQVGASEAAVSFANAPNSPIQVNSAGGAVAADFNEDGKPDLAVASDTRADIFLGNGDGTFTSSVNSPIPLPSPPYDDASTPISGPGMVLGDFNRSGHQGLAIGLFSNEAAAILFGNGDGTFTNSGTLANTLGVQTISLVGADFNADGNLDLVASNSVSGASPITLLGYGHGAFNPVVPNIPTAGTSLAVGDFNEDGKLDVLVYSENLATGTGGVVVFLGNGDGTFTQGSSLTQGAAPNASGSIVVADFNGDGKLDVAACNIATNEVTIFLGDGSGNFAPSASAAVGNSPEAMAVGDFNNDGKLDLAIANFTDNTVTLLLGNGDGTFTAASGSPYPVGKGPFAITAADFNGDGKLDLAVANLTDGTVSILLQQ